MNGSVNHLNTTDETAVENYEKTLYKAFSHSYIKTLEDIWHFDHGSKRIRTKIPYSSQEIAIYQFDDGKKPQAGIAINFDCCGEMQLEMMGFQINKAPQDFCEALYIFSILQFEGGMSVLHKLSSFIMNRIVERGRKIVYSTTSEKRLQQYHHLGFEILHEVIFHDEKKFLLKKTL